MSGRRARTVGRLAVAILALSLLVPGPLLVTGAAGQPASQSAIEPTGPFAVEPEDVDADRIRMNVALAANGSASWTVEFWVELDDNETTAAFESIESDVEADPEPYLTRFADRIETTAATASNATGREMSTEGFAVETERQSLAREYGVIRYAFVWHGFATVDGAELRAGDAIEGYYLDDGTRLLISWPEGYHLTNASPGPDDNRQNAVIWRGSQTDFVSGEPRVVVSSGSTGFSFTSLASGVAVLAAVGLGVGLWYRRRGLGGPTGPLPGVGDAGSEAESTAGRAPDEGTEDDGGLPEEFLSNEERVLRLVEERDGRMKQQEVVSELDWTDAKTSKVVSGLRESGELESFRLGRENVLVLPEEADVMVEFEDRHD